MLPYRKIIFILIALFFSISSSHGETLTLGYFLLEPHLGNKDSRHFGAAIDLWEKYLSKEMNVEINIVGPVPFPRLIRETAAGRINVIPLIAKNDERVKILDYPKEHFTQIFSSIAFMKENKIQKLSDIKDLNGLTLGFFAGGYIHPKLKDLNIIWSNTYNADWIRVNLKILKFGRIDGIYDPDMDSLQYYIKTNKMSGLIRVVRIPEARTPLYSVFSKIDNGLFRKKYEKALPNVLKKITYEELLKKYMDE